ncbi:hypothetical protein QMK19_29285, partial [Streptomyces sp. H10-C2]|nr:hypothetical protein [Streptomyces sp. PH10-H1]MDJ0373644.1 hypothetical protein [Streptomyces sp. H10-C2]
MILSVRAVAVAVVVLMTGGCATVGPSVAPRPAGSVRPTTSAAPVPELLPAADGIGPELALVAGPTTPPPSAASVPSVRPAAVRRVEVVVPVYTAAVEPARQSQRRRHPTPRAVRPRVAHTAAPAARPRSDVATRPGLVCSMGVQYGQISGDMARSCR